MPDERQKGYDRRAMDTKEALLDAAQNALESEAELQRARNREPKHRRRRRVLPGVFALTVAISLYALLTHPAWLQTPPLPSDPPAVQEANLRIVMYTQAMRVETFVAQYGRLPATLSEAHAAAESTWLEPLEGNAFALHGTIDSVELTLRSTDVFRDFLGDSFEVLAARGRP